MVEYKPFLTETFAAAVSNIYAPNIVRLRTADNANVVV